MKDDLDNKTGDMLPPADQPRRRGRPPTGTALTPAEKQRAYRERQKARRAELRDPSTPVTSKVIDLSELPAWRRK